jgi:hypothetical protein
LLGLRDELKKRNVFKDDSHFFERYFQKSTPKNDENHAQNVTTDDKYDGAGILEGFGVKPDADNEGCDLRNQEGADRFRAEVERLNKLADKCS